jgi:hypothetical protein
MLSPEMSRSAANCKSGIMNLMTSDASRVATLATAVGPETPGTERLVVRDGPAGFFYHPYRGMDYLKTLITGIKAPGCPFVTGDSVAAG